VEKVSYPCNFRLFKLAITTEEDEKELHRLKESFLHGKQNYGEPIYEEKIENDEEEPIQKKKTRNFLNRILSSTRKKL